MLSLPVELRLPIIHHIQDSIPTPLFEDYPIDSIRAIQEFYKVLIALSLYHREWTTIAQSELFRNLFIRDEGKLELLLELLRGDGEFKVYIQQSRRAVLGGNRWWYFPGGRDDDLDELADHCPDLAEMSCVRTEIHLVKLRTSGRSRSKASAY
jgi:hypothetical protein